VEAIFRWIAGIAAAFKRRPEDPSPRGSPAADFKAETRVEREPERSISAGTVPEGAGSKPTATGATIAAIAADARVGPDPQVNGGSSVPPGQHEIQRRRELVRILFNDFWSDRDDKPAAFVDRLNEAETYLNERLVASGEFWQLNPETRKVLGLPVSGKLLKL
jgi:hypothetical protein